MEVTHATCSRKSNGIDIKEGQAIGFLEGKLMTASDNSNDVVKDILSKADLDDVEIITIYWGAEISEREAEKLGADISRQFPKLETEIINGGQPYYDYIIGIE